MDDKNKSLIEKLIAFFKKSPEETASTPPDGYCPNCWGEQEYDQVIRNMYKDNQIDVNNHEKHYSFIQKFVVERLDGIHLKKGDSGMVCPTCRINQ